MIPEAAEKTENVLVSVLIITRNREARLQQCIDSILANSYKNIEIIVLDNGEGASRQEIARYLATVDKRRKIKHIETSPMGFARLRQQAASHAEGEIMMSIDDDCIAAGDAISRIADRFATDDSIGIVGGNIKNFGFQGNSQNKGRGRITANGLYRLIEDPSQADVFGSANMSIRKKAFDEAGGYDPFFEGGLEESDLTLSIRSLGYRVVYDEMVRIDHYHTAVKHRVANRNMDTLRLYLFFKHRLPRGPSAWAAFCRDELGILSNQVKDIRAQYLRRKRAPDEPSPAAKAGPAKNRYLDLFIKALAAGSKLALPRLSIPYLIWKATNATRSRRGKQSRT